jgi:hypothetical protein
MKSGRIPAASNKWTSAGEGRGGSGWFETVGLSDLERAFERTSAQKARKGAYYFPGYALLSGPERSMEKSYRIAAIDVHKKMLAVVLTDAARVGEFRFERRRFGAGAGELRLLETWLAEQGVKEVVMDSTAQYWKPVEGRYKLELAQAHSNKAPKGRKRDFADAERLARRYVAGELILSFVADEEQRLWRTMTRTKQQLTRDRVRLQTSWRGFWRRRGSSCPATSLRPFDHWRSTQVSLIQDKLTIPVTDRVKGAGQDRSAGICSVRS